MLHDRLLLRLNPLALGSNELAELVHYGGRWGILRLAPLRNVLVFVKHTLLLASAPASGFGDGVLVFAVSTALSAGTTTSLMLRLAVGAAGAASCGGSVIVIAVFPTGLGGIPFALLAAGPVGGLAGMLELGPVVRLAPGGTYAFGAR